MHIEDRSWYKQHDISQGVSPDCLLLTAPLVPPPHHPLALKTAVGVACQCCQALEDSASPVPLLQPQSPAMFATCTHVSTLADYSIAFQIDDAPCMKLQQPSHPLYSQAIPCTSSSCDADPQHERLQSCQRDLLTSHQPLICLQ